MPSGPPRRHDLRRDRMGAHQARRVCLPPSPLCGLRARWPAHQPFSGQHPRRRALPPVYEEMLAGTPPRAASPTRRPARCRQTLRGAHRTTTGVPVGILSLGRAVKAPCCWGAARMIRPPLPPSRAMWPSWMAMDAAKQRASPASSDTARADRCALCCAPAATMAWNTTTVYAFSTESCAPQAGSRRLMSLLKTFLKRRTRAARKPGAPAHDRMGDLPAPCAPS